MKIIIYGNNNDSEELLKKVNLSLEELGLESFVEIETSHDEKLKQDLSITKEPALIVEEEAIEFRDTIFEGIIPNEDELKGMFVSIIGGPDMGGCSTAEGGCPTGCAC